MSMALRIRELGMEKSYCLLPIAYCLLPIAYCLATADQSLEPN